MKMQISFPGGVAVAAHFDGFEVTTDQSPTNGGSGSAPSPFDLFLSSLGTCAGFYALRFCQERGLPNAGLGMTLEAMRHEETRHLEQVVISLALPPDFPEKYHRAILRAIDQCTVKKVLAAPPEIRVDIA